MHPDSGQQAAVMDLASSLPSESKPPGEDSVSMTIEFLRARLLSERSVSKAARERADQLANKVQELEHQLEYEIQLRKKLEAVRFELLLKYKEELGPDYCFSNLSQDGSDWDTDQYKAPSRQGKHDSEVILEVEDKDGSFTGSMDHVHGVSDSARHLNNEEHNEDDVEMDRTVKEKGILSWGRRKASRKLHDKDFGSGIEWMGRSVSQRSFASLDGESPQKRWVGKSVRKIRKNQSRREEEEKDTEVERVLEQQAEFIEQFEAEESEQRAWEARYEEQKARDEEQKILASHEYVEKAGAPSKASEVKHVMETEYENDGNAKDVEDEHKSPIQHADKIMSHLTGSLVAVQCDLSFPIDEIIVGNDGNNSVDSIAAFDGTYSCHREMSRSSNKVDSLSGISDVHTDSSDNVATLQSTQDLVSIKPEGILPNQDNRDINIEDDMTNHTPDCSIEVEKPNRYRKHLSSSFRFAVHNESDQITVGSPEMPGFASIESKIHLRDKLKDTLIEEPLKCALANAVEWPSNHGVSENRNHSENSNSNVTAFNASICVSGNSNASGQSSNSQTGTRETQSVVLNMTQDNRLNMAAGNHLVDGNLQSGNTGHHDCTSANAEGPSDHGVSKTTKRTKNSTSIVTTFNEHICVSGNSTASGQSNNSQTRSTETQPMVLNMSQESQSNLAAENNLVDRNLLTGNIGHHDYSSAFPLAMASFSTNPELQYGSMLGDRSKSGGGKSVAPVSTMSDARMNPGITIQNRHKSLDGLERVDDVLRALQLAKHQIQTSRLPLEGVDIAYRGAYDGKDVFYTRPSNVLPHHAAHASYLSHDLNTYPANIPGWGASYVGSSRQSLNTVSYAQYGSRMPERRPVWHQHPSPSDGLHSDLHSYGAPGSNLNYYHLGENR